MSEIFPFSVTVPQADLDDLRERLARTRWPEAETVDGWQQGVPLERLQAICTYWREAYDWRRCEARLNALPQFRTEIGGLGIHFIHLRSPEPDATPLIISHGWPGSIVELLKVIEPLADPARFGGDPRAAFHVVAPSLPGYGFSDRPVMAGWGADRIALSWAELMRRLGYDHYVAQGGDWGSLIATRMAALKVSGLQAIHLNMLGRPPPEAAVDQPTEQEKGILAARTAYQQDSAYAFIQATRPQTVGYALADSPVAQAAWIYEKFYEWTDNRGDPEDALSKDDMLDAITIYWLTATGGSSAKLYWQAVPRLEGMEPVELRTGVSMFHKEFFRLSRRWAEPLFPNIIYWNEVPAGGHFAAFEQPEKFVRELQNFSAALKASAT